MHAEIITVTPELANKWLNQNNRNRNLNPNHVRQLAEEIKVNWKLNGDAIRFSNERLIDGQHRLHACVSADTPFTTLVITGVSDDCFDTIDVGSKRTIGAILGVDGEKNYNSLAATVKAYNACRNGYSNSTLRVPATKVKSILNENPEIRNSVSFGTKNHRSCPLSKAQLSTVHYIVTSQDRGMGLEFCDKLVSGEGLTKGNPILTLRNRLISLQATRNGGIAGQRMIYALCIKAWDLYKQGNGCLKLVYNPESPFPRI